MFGENLKKINPEIFTISKVENKEVAEDNGRFIPMHLWKLVDDIWNRGLDQPELFTTNGDYEELNEVIRVLDTNDHIDQVKIYFIFENSTRLVLIFLINLF